MKANARPTFTKLLITRVGPTIAAFLAVVLVAGSQQIFGDEIKDFDKAAKDIEDAAISGEKVVAKVAKDAGETIDKANKEAKDNIPEDADAKKAADDWDKKGREADDATKANEKAAKEAEKTAKDAADKAAEDDQKAKDYIKALEKRRKARKILKAAIAKLEKFKRAQDDKAWNTEDLDKLIKGLKKKLNEDAAKTIAMGTTVPHDGEFATLVSTGKITVATAGTGETIGHVADIKIKNLTGKAISFTIPAVVLESGSGKNQHYACPHPQAVAIGPNGSKTVPMDGVCLVRGKPPVGKDDKEDLIVREGGLPPGGKPEEPPAGGHLPQKDVGKLLRVTTSYYAASEKLEKKGTLRGMPYPDSKTRQEIATQWGVWSDPQIAKCTGAPPATKEDLKATIYKQAGKHGPVTPATQKKLDEGIDTIFQDIQLTTKEAKNLEAPDPQKDI